MSSRKTELENAKKQGEAIVEKNIVGKQFGDKRPTLSEAFTEDGKVKEEAFTGSTAPKAKTWNDVKTENDNDPARISDWLNNSPDYEVGDLTKQGMKDFGYSQGEDGKWAKETSNDDVLDNLESTMAETKLPESTFTKEDGEVDEAKTKSAISKWEQNLIKMGAGEYDTDGNFILKPVNDKSWETWATMISCGLSVLGLAFGVPIIPINFKAITGKDAKDAQIRALQQQYNNVLGSKADKVMDMEADVEAGNIARKNKDALKAQEEHTQAMGAYKTKSDIDTESQKELIDAQSQARLTELKEQLLGNERLTKLEMQHAKEMAALSDELNTNSAIKLTSYSKTGWIKDYIKSCKEEGLSNKEIALAIAGLGGTTPTQMGLKNAKDIVDMATGVADTAAGFIPGNKGDK